MFRYDRLDDLVRQTGKKKNFLAIKMGHYATYLNDAKKQNTNIKIEEVEILANELGTTVEYLTGESDQKEKDPTENGEVYEEIGPYQRQLLEAVADMTPEEMAVLLDRIEKIKASRI